MSITRRDFVKTAAVVGMTTALGMSLSACSKEPAFQPNFTVSAAFAPDEFKPARNLARQTVEENQLIAAHFPEVITPTTDFEYNDWVYLFASYRGGYAYSVYGGTGGTIAPYASYALLKEEWDNVGLFEDIAIDSDVAFNMLCEAYPEELSNAWCANVYLFTYVKSDKDPLENAMKWFFELNYAIIDGEVTASDKDGNPIDPATLTGMTFTVDSRTGEIERTE